MSRGRSFKSVLETACRILTWILPFAIAAVPFYWVITHFLVPAFYSNSIVPAGYLSSDHVDRSRCYMSWQEPFNYEVSFYASEISEFPNMRNNFFNNSQLLWRTEPQNIRNKYPVLQKTVSINLSSKVLSQEKTVFIYAFAQRYGQFTTYPNISDPLMVGSRARVFGWKEPNIFDEHGDDKLQSSKNKLKPIYLPISSWSISLENVAYPKEDVPKLMLRPRRKGFYSGVCLYQPLLFPNMFTSRKIKPAYLPSISDPSLKTDIYQTSVEVSLEFRGISQGWVALRLLINNSAIKITKDSLANTDIINEQKQSNTDGDLPSILYRFIANNSVFELLVIGLCVILFLIPASVITRINLGLLVGPSSDRAGFSRLTLILYLISAILTVEFYTLSGIFKLLVNPVFIFRSVNVLVFAELPLNLRKWIQLVAMRLSNFQSGTSVELIAHPEDQSKANDTNTRAIYEKRITRIRTDTDNAFTTRIFQLWFPIAVLLLTSSFYRLGYRASMGAIFRDMVHSVIMLTNATASAIQLVVNHRARSGSLVPIGLTLCAIFVLVDYKIFSHYCGFDILHLSIFDELIIVVPSAIHLAQWVAFYKSKQE